MGFISRVILRYLVLENLVSRHQIAVLERPARRPVPSGRDHIVARPVLGALHHVCEWAA